MTEHRRDAFDAAEEKGRAAFLAGERESQCPYRDHRTYYGAVTFSRGFINAWIRGYRAAKQSSKKGQP